MSLSARLQELRRKHANLSRQVEEAQKRPGSDALQVTALKKEKLRIKEEIERLSHA